jgi:hypothetical protein
MLRKKKSKRATSDDVNCIFIFIPWLFPAFQVEMQGTDAGTGTDIRTGMLLDSI